MNIRPNIVVFITDSQGLNLLGAVGSGSVATPVIDAIAKSGVTFSRAYSVGIPCAPARAALLTGQYPGVTGVWSNDQPLGANVRTVGEYFQREGYRTAFVGKWHLDGTDYFGTGIPASGYDPGFWYDGRNYLNELSETDTTLWRQGLRDAEDIHRHEITRDFTWAGGITKRARDFLRQKGSKNSPFLLVVSYDEPHDPSTCPPPFCDMYQNHPLELPANAHDPLTFKPRLQQLWSKQFDIDRLSNRIHQPLYLGCSSFVDSEIGLVMEEVSTLTNRPTVVVFTSDHGHYLGAHGLDGKGPAMYEEIVRVPLVISAPHAVASDRTCGQLASHVDIVPTLLDIAEIEIPPIVSGKSLLPLISSDNEPVRDAAFSEFTRFSVSHDSWFGFYPIRSIVTLTHKLNVNLFDTDEFYDLTRDPGEMNNLVATQGEMRGPKELLEILLSHMDGIRDPFRGPIWGARPWSGKAAMNVWSEGFRRLRPSDGFLPNSVSYVTGFPG